MRYVVSFFDRTTRRVDQAAARMFMQAQMTGDPVFYRGSTYSGKTIASVRTILGFYQDKMNQVREDGGFFCRYGSMHETRLECGCKDARFEKMLTPEEATLLPGWDERREQEYAALSFPKQLS